MDTYEKKYKEALERASKLRVQNPFDTVSQMMEHVFPELKESEDERIRRAIIELVRQSSEVLDEQNQNNMVAWLNKQGEYKSSEEVLKIRQELYQSGYNDGYKHGCEDSKQGKLKSADISIKEKAHQIAWEMSKHYDPLLSKESWCEMAALDMASWLEKQDIFSKKDVDDAYLKGVGDTKNELEKQYEANYQIRKDIATFIFNYKGDIKDKAKWMNYLGIKVSFVDKQGEQPQGKSAHEAVREEKVDSQNCVKPANKAKFKVGDWIIGIGIVVNYTKTVFQVIEIKRGIYIIRDNIINHIFHIDIDECERTGRLWELSDAMAGDVLFYKGDINHSNGIKYDRICLFNNLDNAFFSLTKTSNYIEEYDIDVNIDYPDNTVPATKEQSDILFKAMADAGYTFDFDKKELKKIDNK